ncbi:MAG: type IV pilus modification protein PilV [Pseudoxanthomonas sp.]
MKTNKLAPRTRGGGKRLQAGELLIEVLIAVLVTGIGLLGIAAMQATALRNSQSALQRSQAATQIHAIFDAMRANRAVALASGYALSRTCTVPTTGTTLATSDISEWIQSLHDTLGSAACGTISCSSDVCTATVDWDDSRASDASEDGVASGASTYKVSVEARL